MLASSVFYTRLISHKRGSIPVPSSMIQLRYQSLLMLVPMRLLKSGAIIEDEAYIGPGCVIGRNSVIGPGVYLHANVTVYYGCFIGQNTLFILAQLSEPMVLDLNVIRVNGLRLLRLVVSELEKMSKLAPVPL